MKRHRKLSLIAFADSYHSVYTILKSWLILSLVTLTVPVIQGCDKHMHPQDGDFTEEETDSSVKLAVRKADQAKIRTLDAFVFNADPLKRLDCYQRYEEAAKEQFLIGSCAGEKIILLCANSPWGKVGWEEVQSLQRASSLKVDLEDEDSDYPVMSAQVRLSAGCDTSGITLERLTSEIELRSVRCDFSGKPYEGEAITDARAYLTNANATFESPQIISTPYRKHSTPDISKIAAAIHEPMYFPLLAILGRHSASAHPIKKFRKASPLLP